MMAFAAAEADDFLRDDYDYNLVVISLCTSLFIAGMGWLGLPGSVPQKNRHRKNSVLMRGLY